MEGPAGNEEVARKLITKKMKLHQLFKMLGLKSYWELTGEGYYTINGGSATFSYQNKKADGVFTTGVGQSFFSN